MIGKRSLYILLVIVVAGFSALTGALAGGAVVYRALPGSSQILPAPIQEILPSESTNPNQTLTLNTTDIETSITQAVEKVGPAVVTVVGTIPGQLTFFGPTGDQTVSGTGFFVACQPNGVFISLKSRRIALPVRLACKREISLRRLAMSHWMKPTRTSTLCLNTSLGTKSAWNSCEEVT